MRSMPWDVSAELAWAAVTHTAGADTYEHLDKVGTRDAKERHARLAGNGLGQQRFTGARRANQQHATRDLGAQLR